MTQMNKFNVGDLVYYPDLGNKIFRLEAFRSNIYPLCIKIPNPHPGGQPGTHVIISLDHNGVTQTHHKNASIFKATEENRASLTALYGNDFQSIDEYLKASKINTIKELLKENAFVPCWCSNWDSSPSTQSVWDYITEVTEDGKFKGHVTDWIYATAFDPKTGQPI